MFDTPIVSLTLTGFNEMNMSDSFVWLSKNDVWFALGAMLNANVGGYVLTGEEM